MTIAPPRRSDETLAFVAPARLGDDFGVYIHVPFCAHICPYCDFNTYAGQSDRIPRYIEAVKRETALSASQFAGRTARTIFIGGGTPSQLATKQINEMIATCQSNFDVSPHAEVTVEANPNDLDEIYCSELLEAGVNRISIGAQTLDRRGLRVLGRLHEADHVALAVAAARRAGFENLSLDLIYGWPGQTIDRWQADLNKILAGDVGGSPPEHLSLYGLIVEPGTPMADAVHRGILTPVDDDGAADFHELAMSLLAQAGWIHYEIANWAATANTASRHNAIYWRNGDYAGIGAGAHGHNRGSRTMNQLSPRRYIHTLEEGHSPVTNVEEIDERTAMGETMMLGLRLLVDGVSAPAFLERHGVSIVDQYGTQISRLTSQGLLELEAGTRSVRLTKRGQLLANSVCAEFV